MKTRALLVMSAFLLSATGPVFAWTNQDQLVCEVAQVNCSVETESLEPRATSVNSGSWNQDQFVCDLAQVNCPAETKNFEPRAAAIKGETKNRDQLACELAQVNCQAGAKSL